MRVLANDTRPSRYSDLVTLTWALERWGIDFDTDVTPAVDSDSLSSVFETIEHDRGTTLEVYGNEFPQLLLSVDDGRYVVVAVVRDGLFCDRIGNPDAVGSVDLILGGQTTEGVPSKFCLTRDQALGCLLDYVSTRTITIADGWEEQTETWGAKS